MSSSECYSAGQASPPLVVVGFGSIIVISVWSRYFYNFNPKTKSNPSSKGTQSVVKSNKKDSKQIKTAAAIALTLYLIGIILFFCSILVDLLTNCEIFFSLAAPAFIINYSGFTTLLISFGLRVVKTFEDTVYAVPAKNIIYFKYGAVFTYIYLIIISILGGTFVLPIPIVGILAFFWSILNIIGAIILLRLFIKKLNLVINDFIKLWKTVEKERVTGYDHRKPKSKGKKINTINIETKQKNIKQLFNELPDSPKVDNGNVIIRVRTQSFDNK